MRSNGLLKWLMIPVALLVLFVGARLFSGSSKSPNVNDATDATARLTPEEMKVLGIEGDTPRDTVATLVAQVRQLRTELQGAVADNKSQRSENERLRLREAEIDQRINTALESERDTLRREQAQASTDREQAEGLLQDLQRRLEGLGGPSGQADLPVGLGLREGDGMGLPGEAVRWIEPEDAKPADPRNSNRGSSFPTRFGPAQQTLEGAAEALSAPGPKVEHQYQPGAKSAKAVYTVPTNSTLMGSVAMTALIGRIPIDGTVTDPYPFKVLVGPDNLTANGIDLPDVAGAVFSGTAAGDWTLSCVRGAVRSITFVFNDGTIRTVPDDSDGKQQSNQGDGLGWISDPHGIPCVSGERRSNAQQYLGTQALITAAGAGAASLIKSDKGVSVSNNGSGSLGTVGITADEAVGRILSAGVQDMSAWVNKLYGQAFAAVYVRPGAQVAVHLDRPIAIDYEPEGRKVDHRIGGSHAQDLD
ncbi:TPA: TIGR03752 family integrating conjugative element protein [Pseudomonas aeruginosa]